MTKLLAIFLVATLVGCSQEVKQVTPVHIAEAQKLCESSSGFTIDDPATYICGFPDTCPASKALGRLTCANGSTFRLRVEAK